MKLIIILLLLSSSVVAQKHPKYVQLLANRERIRHYVPDMYRLVKQTTSTTDGNVSDVPVDTGIGMCISPKAVAYTLNDTEIVIISYTLYPVEISFGVSKYIRDIKSSHTKGDALKITTWSIDGWIPVCIKNDTLLMQQTHDDVTVTKYWKRR